MARMRMFFDLDNKNRRAGRTLENLKKLVKEHKEVIKSFSVRQKRKVKTVVEIETKDILAGYLDALEAMVDKIIKKGHLAKMQRQRDDVNF